MVSVACNGNKRKETLQKVLEVIDRLTIVRAVVWFGKQETTTVGVVIQIFNIFNFTRGIDDIAAVQHTSSCIKG